MCVFGIVDLLALGNMDPIYQFFQIHRLQKLSFALSLFGPGVCAFLICNYNDFCHPSFYHLVVFKMFNIPAYCARWCFLVLFLQK